MDSLDSTIQGMTKTLGGGGKTLMIIAKIKHIFPKISEDINPDKGNQNYLNSVRYSEQEWENYN